MCVVFCGWVQYFDAHGRLNWIVDAMKVALDAHTSAPLDVHLVHYRASDVSSPIFGSLKYPEPVKNHARESYSMFLLNATR